MEEQGIKEEEWPKSDIAARWEVVHSGPGKAAWRLYCVGREAARICR
jgi:hypothetical protein